MKTSCGLRVACCVFRVTSYELRVTGYELRVAGYGLRVTRCGLRVTRCEVRVSSKCVIGDVDVERVQLRFHSYMRSFSQPAENTCKI